MVQLRVDAFRRRFQDFLVQLEALAIKLSKFQSFGIRNFKVGPVDGENCKSYIIKISFKLTE